MPLGQRSTALHSHKRTTHRVIPHKSGVHRVACFALYKLLLQQIPHTPLSQPLLRNVLRTEFRKDAHLRIHADIRQSLTTGYKTLHLLHSLRSQPPTSEEIASLNNHLHTFSQPSTTSSPAVPKSPPLPPPRLTPFPNGNKILDRPLPASSLSGKRHIPKLINANGFPMLRVKKPQPALISKIIRDKIAQRQRRIDAVAWMEEEMVVWSKDEDIWDAEMRVLGREGGGGGAAKGGKGGKGGDDGEGSYTETARECIRYVNGLLAAEVMRQTDLARRMWEIVLKERELADREREERKRAKIDAWLVRVRSIVERRGLEWEDRSAKAVATGMTSGE